MIAYIYVTLDEIKNVWSSKLRLIIVYCQRQI